MASFPDHFSSVAAEYATSRPTYPLELLSWIAAQCSEHYLAWDCATGSGQTAVALADFFDVVIASDASDEQIAHARAAHNVRYRCFPAEQADLSDQSVDLITVAQAFHWFDLEAFIAEAYRVLRPTGLIAVWSYGRNVVDDSGELTGIIDDFHDRLLEPFWPAERRHVLNGYADLPFPFTELEVPQFTMRTRWTLGQLLDYFGTWSAVVRYRRARGIDPREEIAPMLARHWGAPDRIRPISWPLTVRAGHPRPASITGS